MARRLATLFAASLLLIAASCSKTTENVGNGLLPEGDHFGVYYTDTLHIECHSQIIDSMATKGMTTALLGSIVDPDLGRTTANLFTQLRLSATNQHFGNNPSIDSVVLQLGVIGYFGVSTVTRAHPESIYLWFLIAAMGFPLFAINLGPMVLELGRDSDSGRYMGYYYAAVTGAQIVTPTLASLFINAWGYRVIGIYGAACTALALLAMLPVRHGDVKLSFLRAFQDSTAVDD